MLCPSGSNSAIRPKGRMWSETAEPPVRFCTPLATSPIESGLPGITTPGTFRTWACAALLRFTPLSACLPCFMQAPPVGFKERVGNHRLSRTATAHCPKATRCNRLAGRCNHRSDCPTHRARLLNQPFGASRHPMTAAGTSLTQTLQRAPREEGTPTSHQTPKVTFVKSQLHCH